MNVKRQDGKAKRRFRWNQKPSRKYLQVIAQLRRVERKRIKTLQAEEHRITTEIVRNHQVIAIEDTAIINMTRSARGTAENPGKNVAQKRGLNRSILSQRWAAISQKLETSPDGMEDSASECQRLTRAKRAQPADTSTPVADSHRQTSSA